MQYSEMIPNNLKYTKEMAGLVANLFFNQLLREALRYNLFWRCLIKSFPLGLENFAKTLGENCLFLTIELPIFLWTR